VPRRGLPEEGQPIYMRGHYAASDSGANAEADACADPGADCGANAGAKRHANACADDAPLRGWQPRL